MKADFFPNFKNPQDNSALWTSMITYSFSISYSITYVMTLLDRILGAV